MDRSDKLESTTNNLPDGPKSKKINSKEESSQKRNVNFEIVTDDDKLRSNKALNTTRELNKNLKMIKMLSQKNLLSSSYKQSRFAGSGSLSKSHEVM